MDENNKINRMLQLVAEQSIDKASQVLSKALKQGAKIELRRVEFVDITKVTENAYRDNREVTGAFIDLVGDAPFKFLFFVRSQDAFILADLFLNQQVGTITEFDEYVSSAVSEIGNILSIAVSNVFAADFQVSMKPSPPVVVRDFSGTIFEEFILGTVSHENKTLLIESCFNVLRSKLDCRMYIMPKPGSERVLT